MVFTLQLRDDFLVITIRCIVFIFLLISIRWYLYSAPLRLFSWMTIKWYSYSATMWRFPCNYHAMVFITLRFFVLVARKGWEYYANFVNFKWLTFNSEMSVLLMGKQGYTNSATLNQPFCNDHTMIYTYSLTLRQFSS